MIDFQRAFTTIPALALLLLAACGSDGTGSTSTGAGGSSATATASSTGVGGAMASTTTGTGAPMCDLYLYPDRPACQTRMDTSCCAEEQACAADEACSAFVDCLYECPEPKDEICLNTCGNKTPQESQDKLTAIGHCSAMAPPLPDQSCKFP